MINWATLTLPAVFGQYTLLNKLGEGGMATVFSGLKAHGDAFQQPVAIKVLSQVSLSAAALESLKREARAGMQLKHPHIVETIEYTTLGDAGTPALVLELIDGCDLDSLVPSRSNKVDLPPSVVVEIAIALCDALAYAHGRQTIHRDLKPANVMLTGMGNVKLMDFGIAKVLTEDNDATATATGMTKGTPVFMSPEQVAGRPLDGRSDLFSLGSLLFNLTTGILPFKGNSLVGLMHAVLQCDRVATPVPAKLKYGSIMGIIDQLMQVDPQDRPKDAQSVKALFEEVAVGEPSIKQWLQATGRYKAAPAPVSRLASLGSLDIEAVPELPTSEPSAEHWAYKSEPEAPAQTPEPGPTRMTKSVEEPRTGHWQPASKPHRRQKAPPKAPSNKSKVFALAGVALLLLGLAVWGLVRERPQAVATTEPTPEVAPEVVSEPATPEVMRLEITPKPVKVARPTPVKEPTPEPPTPKPVRALPPVETRLVVLDASGRPLRVKIAIDGKEGATPFKASLTPGNHTATITYGGNAKRVTVRVPEQGGLVKVTN